MSKRFALIKGTVVDAVVLAEAPIDTGTGEVWVDLTNVSPQPGPTWTYENGVFAPPPPPPPLPNVITKVAFRFRFTDAEYAGILAAAKTDVEVQAWYDLFQAASKVDLKDQRTIDGINLLVGKNLLTADRANTILTTPAQPGE